MYSIKNVCTEEEYSIKNVCTEEEYSIKNVCTEEEYSIKNVCTEELDDWILKLNSPVSEDLLSFLREP